MAYTLWLVGHFLHCLADDEPEDPEAIPEHKQLDASRLLSKLPDKELISEMQLKSAKSYHQRFAQNVILIDALLILDRPSNGLLKFCNTLETTPGQEHIGKKLLQGIQTTVVSRALASGAMPSQHLCKN